MFGSVQFRAAVISMRILRHHRHVRPRPAPEDERPVIAEIEALRVQKSHRLRRDDNLIGNKKAIKALLRDLVAGSRSRLPMSFFTEASLDLAEDPELLQLMVAANFGASSSASNSQ